MNATETQAMFCGLNCIVIMLSAVFQKKVI